VERVTEQISFAVSQNREVARRAHNQFVGPLAKPASLMPIHRVPAAGLGRLLARSEILWVHWGRPSRFRDHSAGTPTIRPDGWASVLVYCGDGRVTGGNVHRVEEMAGNSSIKKNWRGHQGFDFKGTSVTQSVLVITVASPKLFGTPGPTIASPAASLSAHCLFR
jgi:hypothetical protein